MSEKEIPLIYFKSSVVDWGWVLYPAKEEDRSLFYHCTGVTAEYMLIGGVIHDEFKKLVWDIFKLHGYRPVVVEMEHADYDIKLLKGEEGHLENN